MKSIRVLVFAISLILIAGATSAYAGLAVDFTSPGVDSTNGNWSLGWKFTVNEPIVVEALGFYDDQKNGLTQTHDVGIFNSAETLIVSGQVQPGDPLVSWWRWTTVTPTTLVPGESYQIAAVTGDENYTYIPTGFVAAPEVNFLLDSWYLPPGGGVLAYPNSTDNLVGYFGPNFATEVVSVPAPGALLLLIPGVAGVLGLRRRLS